VVLTALVATDDEQRVTVGRRSYDGFGADVAAGARPVVDDELLAQAFREPLRDQARVMSVGPPAAKPTMTRTGRAG
jgi:hypothetical protein